MKNEWNNIRTAQRKQKTKKKNTELLYEDNTVKQL